MIRKNNPDTLPSKLLSLDRRREKMEDLYTELSGQFRHGFAVVLPWGRDPGNMDRAYMRDYVAREAKSMGVKVSWKRK